MTAYQCTAMHQPYSGLSTGKMILTFTLTPCQWLECSLQQQSSSKGRLIWSWWVSFGYSTTRLLPLVNGGMALAGRVKLLKPVLSPFGLFLFGLARDGRWDPGHFLSWPAYGWSFALCSVLALLKCEGTSVGAIWPVWITTMRHSQCPIQSHTFCTNRQSLYTSSR